MKIGILGATGAVGRQMLECIEERNLEPDEIRLFASERSKGKKIPYKEKELEIQTVEKDSFEGLDYVLGAVSNELARKNAERIIKAGAVFVDNSSAFRLDKDVPLVIPEINGEDALQHHGIIGNPNCSTIITLMAAAPIARISPIEKMYATTFQAVSGAGMKGIQELHDEMECVRNSEEVHPQVFPAQIADNVIAEIGSYTEDGYTTEEQKMQNEGRKILHMPEMLVTCTCVRVPVYRSHSISVDIITKDHVSVEEAEKAVQAFSGDVLMKEHVPTPLETSNQDLVCVGRIREDHCEQNGIALWCTGDQIRKGAASNAVQIIEYLNNRL